jgi:Kef-type K+ transport system membrane component KefB
MQSITDLGTGGLTTDLQKLKSHLARSLAVAVTGICIPIGLSFLMMPLSGASPLQAFTMGAALSSTSLGTTMTVLQRNDLVQTRVGIILVSAALIDDVAGLIMVRIVVMLGSTVKLSPIVVIRPIVVSVGFVVLILATSWLVIKPVLKFIAKRSPFRLTSGVLDVRQIRFIFGAIILFAFVAACSYAGTSDLFAAYIAGSFLSWTDAEYRRQEIEADRDVDAESRSVAAEEYEPFCSDVVNRLLLPLFFVSRLILVNKLN